MAENQKKQGGQQAPPATTNQNQLQIIKKDIVDVVGAKINEYINEGALHLPEHYSADNAIKSAWLALQSTQDRNGNSALAVCTRDSIANSLLDMVVQGLSPAKKQCYFIVHGKQLTLRRSYFGTLAVAKRLLNLRDAFAAIVYDDDTFEYEIRPDRIVVTLHEQNVKNIKPDCITAAYCCLMFRDDTPDYTEIMTWEQIQKSWKKAAANIDKADSPHKEFPDQMAKRTVINRACKTAINTTDDSGLLLDSFIRTTDNEFNQEPEQKAQALAEELEGQANATLVDLDDAQGETDAGAGQQQTIGAEEPPF